MGSAETFGIERGYGKEALQWMNEQAKKQGWKFEARLYGHEINTRNFGTFEMFSWIGDNKVARNLVRKVSKRLKIRVIEGGYRAKEKIIKMKKTDYAMVRKGDRILGHLEFSAPRIVDKKWELEAEHRK